MIDFLDNDEHVEADRGYEGEHKYMKTTTGFYNEEEKKMKARMEAQNEK